MDETLTIYQQYMLEESLMYIGVNPFIMLCSNDSEILNCCKKEILQRISDIECIYDYSDDAEFIIDLGKENRAWLGHKWLDEIISKDKNLMIMDFDKKMEERIKSNPKVYNEEYVSQNVLIPLTYYQYAAWQELAHFRDFMTGQFNTASKLATMIIPCSNKFQNIGIADLRDFVKCYCLDEAKKYCSIISEDEEKIKTYIKNLRQINHHKSYK